MSFNGLSVRSGFGWEWCKSVAAFPMLLMAALIGPLTSMPAHSIDAKRSVVESSNELLKVHVELSSSSVINVFLPADLRSGDTVSGLIRIQAIGVTRKEETRNKRRLANTVIVFGLSAVPARSGVGTWHLPETDSMTLPLFIEDRSGRQLAEVEIPITAFASNDPLLEELVEPGYVGNGVVKLPGRFEAEKQTRLPAFLDSETELLAISPRSVVLLDRLRLRVGPQRVTCCSEGGPCGLSSCCVDIPSTSCTFCTFAGYEECLAAGP